MRHDLPRRAGHRSPARQVAMSGPGAGPHPSSWQGACPWRPGENAWQTLRPRPRRRQPSRRTYVLDTSVLLADPAAMSRFAEHEVVLPIVVITELEAKRHHPELGYFARKALRFLDDLRVTHGTAGRAHADRRGHPPGRAQPQRPVDPARRLPARRQRHPHPGRGAEPRAPRAATSCWSPRTCRCGSRPPPSGSPRRSTAPSCVVESGWTGMAELAGDRRRLETLYEHGSADLEPTPATCPRHTGCGCCPSAARRWAG